MVSAWYLVVRGNDSDLAALDKLCESAPDHFLAQEAGEWRLRSSTVGSTLDHDEAGPALRDLLVQLSDVAAGVRYTRVRVVPGALGRTRPDGTSDLFVHPEPARLRLQGLPPMIVVNGARPEPMEVKLRRLQVSNKHLRLALHFLNADLSWFNLWKAYEPIRDANGGLARLIARGWTSEQDIGRFRATANTYAAVGDDARHAMLAGARPPNPMGLEEAEDYVRAILARWVDSLA
jgi:hypothetical protein